MAPEVTRPAGQRTPTSASSRRPSTAITEAADEVKPTRDSSSASGRRPRATTKEINDIETVISALIDAEAALEEAKKDIEAVKVMLRTIHVPPSSTQRVDAPAGKNSYTASSYSGRVDAPAGKNSYTKSTPGIIESELPASGSGSNSPTRSGTSSGRRK